MRPRPLVVFDRLDLLEWQFCQRIARLSIYRPWRITLQAASRLGDWPIWVLLILAQPWLQPNGAWRVLQYSVIALFAVAVYRLVKTRLCRERPFALATTGGIAINASNSGLTGRLRAALCQRCTGRGSDGLRFCLGQPVLDGVKRVLPP